jgi:putative transcriptional regulator
MNVNHHPDDATLLSYAAGSLVESFEILVACHLSFCPRCKERVSEAEALGAALLQETKPEPLTQGREAFMQLLDSEPLVHPAVAENSETFNRRRALPEPLKQLLQGNSDSLVWRRLVPGIQQIRLNTSDGGLRLLKISPGMSMPLHSHKSSELTLIMEGSYSDELGRFQRGDVADLDCDVEHQPITDGNTPCICLVATDASLVFRGFLPKLLQPFTGF